MSTGGIPTKVHNAETDSVPEYSSFNYDPWSGGNHILPWNADEANEAVKADLRSFAMQQQAQGFNSAEAAKARNWEKMMSDTAFQRRVADLQAAGFSPLAALGGASGASTPSAAVASSGGSASGHAAKSTDGGLMKFIGMVIGAIISKGMSSAMVAQEMQSKAQSAMDIANAKIRSSEKIAADRLAQRAFEFDENSDWRMTREKIRQLEANSAEQLAKERLDFDKFKFAKNMNAAEQTTYYDSKGRKSGSKTRFKYE